MGQPREIIEQAFGSKQAYQLAIIELEQVIYNNNK